MSDAKKVVSEIIKESIKVKESIPIDDVVTAADKIISMYEEGGKLLLAGNGGSAADAQHFAGELLDKFETERKSLPAIALHCDTSSLTAWANDVSYENQLARALSGLGKKNDIFFGISTSGNSKNIIEAVNEAKKIGLFTICLLGRDGGKLKHLCDLAIIVPGQNTARVQESHITIIHSICRLIDTHFEN